MADRGAVQAGPFAEIDGAFYSRPSVLEKGGDMRLALRHGTARSLRSGLGIIVKTKSAVLGDSGRYTWQAQAGASWRHEFLDNAGALHASFAEERNSGFSYRTEFAGRDSMGLNGRATVCAGEKASLSLHGGTELYLHGGNSLWGKVSLAWKF